MKRYSGRQAGKKQVSTVASSLTSSVSVYCFAISCTKARKKTNYLNTNGEEAKGKPPGL